MHIFLLGAIKEHIAGGAVMLDEYRLQANVRTISDLPISLQARLPQGVIVRIGKKMTKLLRFL